jgi:diguanylate cyclase (GGDEF)-like protein
MVERLKWELEMANGNLAEAGVQIRQTILGMCEQDGLTVHFQPIYSARDGGIFGYEALTRTVGINPFARIDEIFRHAILTDTICTLDYHCRENALREAARLGAQEGDYYLFINVCPEVLMAPEHYPGLTDLFSDKWGIPKERIVLEITEESSINNYKLFKDSVEYYKNRGYKIAIDDFGAGHAGLKMLSMIEPDFVKIDRHFISSIDKANIKYNLVDAVTTACHRIGIQMIAEGIERQEEHKIIQSLGIDYLQGYYFAKPAPSLDAKPILALASSSCPVRLRVGNEPSKPHFATIGDICRSVDCILPDVPFSLAFERFINEDYLRGLPVVSSGHVVGMLHRSRFLEKNILGKCGYGMHLNAHKKVSDLMESNFFTVESNLSLEEVAQTVQSRKVEHMYDDICVTSHGKYLGIVPVSDLLDAITERSLLIAKGSNPLTGLPGNEYIQREIEKHLSQNMHFDVIYIDLDHFKPYNDSYGFEKGDAVIRCLGRFCQRAVENECDGQLAFVGHIGGDDFIILTRPQHSIAVAQRIIADFTERLPEYHEQKDYARGSYQSQNRKGETEEFDLLSLSIGIVSSEVNKFESYPELASLATEIKKLAKKQKGFSIVRDRRLHGNSLSLVPAIDCVLENRRPDERMVHQV